MNRALIYKALTTFALIIAITFALGQVASLVSERQQYQAQAISQVAESYARAQRFVGPVLVVPYTERKERVEKQANGEEKHTLVEVPGKLIAFPTRQNMVGTINPQKRHIGLYDVQVYELLAKTAGQLEVMVPGNPSGASDARTYKKPYLSFVLGDSRGLVGTPKLTINGQTVSLSQGPGPDIKGDGIHVLFDEVFPKGGTQKFDYSMEFVLRGTERLSVSPIADNNRFEFNSSWPHPSFSGSFLPRTRDIGASGFKAAWEISSLASKAQAQYAHSEVGNTDALESINIELVDPVNIYSKTDRATKYGFLFIVLTFAGFFIYELVKSARIHPIQYLLVGLGLVIFFLLLLSLSEHIDFIYAYLVASLSCIGLLGYYLAHVLKKMVYGFGFAAMLSTLYGALYGLLVSEDNALLFGSLLLFAVLAVVMVVTRRVDWYSAGNALPGRERLMADGVID